MGLSGVVNVDKPSGLTSRDVVTAVSKTLGVGKAGHAGTLDPAATGVLLVCVGWATRISSFLMDLPKTYEAVLKLGETTETQDAEGAITGRWDLSGLDASDVERACRGFVGEIDQVPPMYSALKHKGVALYKLARQGRSVTREPRRVRVYAIDIHEIAIPLVRLTVRCSRGTYVRTLCEDIGGALGVGGHLVQLRRTAVGRFLVSDAAPPDRVAADSVIPPGEALSFFPAVSVRGKRESSLLLNGARLPVESFSGAEELNHGDLVRLYHPVEDFVGIGRRMGPDLKVEMLLPTAARS